MSIDEKQNFASTSIIPLNPKLSNGAGFPNSEKVTSEGKGSKYVAFLRLTIDVDKAKVAEIVHPRCQLNEASEISPEATRGQVEEMEAAMLSSLTSEEENALFRAWKEAFVAGLPFEPSRIHSFFLALGSICEFTRKSRRKYGLAREKSFGVMLLQYVRRLKNMLQWKLHLDYYGYDKKPQEDALIPPVLPLSIALWQRPLPLVSWNYLMDHFDEQSDDFSLIPCKHTQYLNPLIMAFFCWHC